MNNGDRPVAVVTGVGPGIGRSTALALGGHGYDVAVAARRPEHLDSDVAELDALDERGLAVPTDMGQVDQSRARAERVAAHFGRLDVVVSSAAKGGPNHTIMNADLATARRRTPRRNPHSPSPPKPWPRSSVPTASG